MMSDMKTLLFMSFFLTCGGTLSGWAVADTLAGRSAGASFLLFGLVIFFIVFAVQVFLFVRARTRLFYQIIFSSSLVVSVAWLLMCLVMPIYWMSVIDPSIRVGIFLFTVWLFICNVFEGGRQFRRRWAEKNPSAIKYYDSKRSTLDWDKVAASLGFSVVVYIPGVPQRIALYLSVLGVISMILGLNLRRIYPMASALAWGIPCIIFSSALMQMISFGVAQALKILEIEAQIGTRIRSKVE